MAGRFDLTAKQAQFWGDIQRAVGERSSTKELWDTIHRALDRLELPMPDGMWQAVNTMRSIAADIRVSSERLARAEEADPLLAEFIGRQIYSRGAENPQAGQDYHVRFTVPKTVGGETTMETYTMLYQGALPATVGELRADLADYASFLAEDYGVALGDVDNIEIGSF